MKKGKFVTQLTETEIEKFLDKYYNVLDVDLHSEDDGSAFYVAIVVEKGPIPDIVRRLFEIYHNFFPEEPLYEGFNHLIYLEDFIAFEVVPIEEPIDLRNDWYDFMSKRFADQGYDEAYDKAYEEQQANLARAEKERSECGLKDENGENPCEEEMEK